MSAGRIRVMLIAVAVCGLVAATVLFFQHRRTLPPEFIRSVSAPVDGLTRVVFSSDGDHLLAGSANGVVLTWRTGAYTRARQLEPAGSQPLTCLVSSEDGLILAGEANGQLHAWQLPEFELTPVDSPRVPVTSAVFRQPAGKKQIILGLTDGRLVTVDDKGITIRKSGHRGVRSMVLLPDGSTLLTGGTEGTLIWYDLKSEERIQEAKEHETEVSAIVVSPDGQQIVTGDWNGELRLWSLDNRKMLTEFQQPDAVSGLVWNGDRVFTGSWDGRIRFWNVTGKVVGSVRSFDTGRAIHALAIHPQEDSLLTVSGSSTVEFWKLPGSD